MLATSSANHLFCYPTAGWCVATVIELLSGISRKWQCQNCYTGLRKTIKTPAELRDWESGTASVSHDNLCLADRDGFSSAISSKSWTAVSRNDSSVLGNGVSMEISLPPKKWRDLRRTMTQLTPENDAICFRFSTYFNLTPNCQNPYIFVIISISWFVLLGKPILPWFQL